MTNPAHSNQLIHETSPYLLQHAHNPVDWYPWGKEALTKAKTEDKPVLVSIGYSACHWCHVMERESFEQEAVAAVMNRYFVCIKVDREERPDVDQLYMDAVQAMGLQGGWPLNVFLTPDQKPFYGGTYFPPKHWSQLMENIAQAYANNRDELEKSAEQFAASVSVSDTEKYGLDGEGEALSRQDADNIYQKLSGNFDLEKGGMKRAPKFPMPVTWQFMLHYFALTKIGTARSHLDLTLQKMARGGIYDQVGGGFARYSVDAEWLVPHFEKMLYDNSQLVSLYAEAYQLTGSGLYKSVAHQTIDFLTRELMDKEGGFYSALDADSEGEEGKFYVWTWEEVGDVLGEEAFLIRDYYQVSREGNWEEGKNILHVKESRETFCSRHNLAVEDFEKKLQWANNKLLAKRAERIRPGLDDKIITAWNGLMNKGLTDAYAAFGTPRLLDLARQNAAFIEKNLRKGNQLWRTYKNGRVAIDGYLDDYAFVIQAYIGLYQVTFEEKWLYDAREISRYVIENFYDEKEALFFYTGKHSERLIARKKEIFDSVIPASNSAMAKNLYFLSLLMDIPSYGAMSKAMLRKVKKLLIAEPGYLTNWASFSTLLLQPTAEVAIVGPGVDAVRKQLQQKYHPNKVTAGTNTTSKLPLLAGREAVEGKTTIFVCYNRTCRLPVHEVGDAFDLMG